MCEVYVMQVTVSWHDIILGWLCVTG